MLQKVKLFIAGLAFGALLLAMAVSEARVASQPNTSNLDSFLPSIETIPDSVQSTQSVDISTNSSANIDINSSTSVESTTDVSSSSSVQVDMTTEGSATQSVDINVDGQNIPCGPGQDYQSPTISCRNRNGRIDLDFQQTND